LIETSGGGGFGDPLEREPERVMADVGEGYVSDGAAKERYGVIADQQGVDATATRRQRDALRARRIRIPLVAADGLERPTGRAIRLDVDAARRLGASVGAVVEIVNPLGAPLRAWVAEIGDAPGAAVSPLAMRMLGMTDVTEVEIRAVHSGVLG
jgi:N-methylhydantoinase B